MMGSRSENLGSVQLGGQAVIEGVMMRGPKLVATAVRRPDGSVLVQKDPFRSLAETHRIFRLPIIRGAVGLAEMLVIGIRTLNFSAEAAIDEAAVTAPPVHGIGNGNGSSPTTGDKSSLRLALTVLISLSAGVVLFFVTPLLVTSLLFSVDQDPVWFNVIAGAMRVGLFLAYLIGISQMGDVRRLFEYHGAEHKAVFALENGEELTVEAAARQSRFHPRCGTSFLLVVMLASIMSFALLDALVLLGLGRLSVWTRLSTHLPLIPLVGGLSYELIRASARHSRTRLGRAVVAPGLWLQRVTTREPDGAQLEVALIALRAALGLETAPASPAIIPRPQEISMN